MKKIISMVLALLMLLPILATMASAMDIPDDVEVANVANKAKISVVDTNGMGVSVGETVDLSKIIDGDKSTGTNSPVGIYYSYMLEYDQVYYFKNITVKCNGKGTLATGGVVNDDTFNVKKIVIRVYDGEEVVYQTEALDVSKVTEITVEPNQKGDRVEVYKMAGSSNKNEYMWEIETYAPDMTMCDAREENVASEAVFSINQYLGYNDKGEPKTECSSFWATNWKALTDGDIKTGTHSPKGKNYSIWMHFPQEFLISQLNVECNTDGGAVLVGNNQTLTDRTYNVSMMQVRIYSHNEDLVWDSDQLDTSTVTTLELSPYVTGAIIELRIFNGNHGGGEYLYEVSAYKESGSHVFKTVSEENPNCYIPGIKEMSCHCGKTIKQAIPATGFHKWDEGVITKNATDSENGVVSKTCIDCGITKDFDIAATGHNWDKGTVVLPDCDEYGYTEYKCTDSGCTASYKDNYTNSIGHEWNQGVITTKPTVDTEGVKTYTCTRSGCGATETKRIRKHKYTDNTTLFTLDNIKSVTQHLTTEFTAEDTKPENLFDGDVDTWWYGPAGSYVLAELDREYIFTSGFFYVSSNWSTMTIEFLNINPDFNPLAPESDTNPKYVVTATYSPGNVDNGSKPATPLEKDMLDSLGGGTKARMIKVTTVNPKWPNGNAAKLQELKMTVHDCVVSEVDYVLSGPDYRPPKCGVDGSCVAICQVCGNEEDVVLKASADVGHSVSDVITDTPATCISTGVGHGVCAECKQTVTGITIAPTGEHDYSLDEVVMSAKCGFAGIGRKVCADCGKAGVQYEIAATGIHEREWNVQSTPSYTAVGKTVYSCRFCGVCDEIDPETGINIDIAEKLAIPSDLLTYVDTSATTDATGNTLTFKFKINLSYLEEIEMTCDVRVITKITDSQGREATIESYGKFATNSYDETTGEFTITIYPKSLTENFTVVSYARLMNFRGTVYQECSAGTTNVRDSL